MVASFRFRHDEHWVDIDLDADPGAWATQRAAAIRAAAGLGANRRAEAALVAGLRQEASGHAAAKPEAAFVLFPEVAGDALASVEALVAEHTLGGGRRSVMAGLRATPGLLEPPRLTELGTAGGVASRGVLRLTDDEGPRPVGVVLYVWSIPDRGGLLTLVVFLADADLLPRVLPFTDELAQGCEFGVDEQGDGWHPAVEPEPPPPPAPPPRTLEIVPARPDHLRGADLPGGLGRMADRGRIRVDVDAGTVTWTGEAKRGGTTVMRLPGHAAPADLPEVHTVCTVLLLSARARRLVFAARDGRCMVLGARTPDFEFRLWPEASLLPLRQYGIEVTDQLVRNRRALDREFPGSNPHWYLMSGWVNGLLFAILFWAIVVAVIVIAG